MARGPTRASAPPPSSFAVFSFHAVLISRHESVVVGYSAPKRVAKSVLVSEVLLISHLCEWWKPGRERRGIILFHTHLPLSGF